MNYKECTNKIILGDCREVLKHFPDNYFDCVCSDVPYKIATCGARISQESIDKFGKADPSGIFNRKICNDRLKSKWLKAKESEDNALFVGSGKLFKHCDIKFSEWLPEVYRVLKEDSHAYFMVNSRNLKKLQIEAEKVGFKFSNLLVWLKNNATPNKYYMQRCEFILFMHKGKAKNIRNMGIKNVFEIKNIIGNKLHPTEKPVELMKTLLEQSTDMGRGNIILDMFCGSGSTLKAADELGLNWVGIELEKKYVDVANKRLFKKDIISSLPEDYTKSNTQLSFKLV